jgi:hypothetical protein
LDECRGIYTLSKYHAKYLSKKLKIQVDHLVHPTQYPDKQWNPDILTIGRFKVVQVGWWLRKLHGIFMLPTGNYEKVFLSKNKVEKSAARIFSIESDYLKSLGEFNDYMYDGTTTVDFLSNEEYDELLANCVIFLDLYDASANNAVVEAIARTTPVLVNRIEPVVEYLGEDYPLFYSTYGEAVDMLHDRDRIWEAHDYLKSCAARDMLSAKYFRHSVLNSNIYQSYLNDLID